MSENPYQSPLHSAAAKTASTIESNLADRSARFLGALIDGVVLSVIILPIVFLVLIPVFASTPDAMQALTYNVGYIISAFFLGQIIFLAVQGYLLSTRGQTVGKLVVKTQILSEETGEIPEFWPLYIKRYLAFGLVYNVPIIGPIISIVNACLIFRENRKCLHDDVAGTKVVKYVG